VLRSSMSAKRAGANTCQSTSGCLPEPEERPVRGFSVQLEFGILGG
jgi:hypothetical protein